MGEFVEVARVEDLGPGRVRKVSANGRAVALCHSPSGIHALDDRCPHRGGSLGEGDLMGEELVCPLHFWTFDVRTGATSPDPSGPGVPRHEVRIENGRILVRLASPAAEENRP